MQLKGALVTHQLAMAPAEVFHWGIRVQITKDSDGIVSAFKLLFDHLDEDAVDD